MPSKTARKHGQEIPSPQRDASTGPDLVSASLWRSTGLAEVWTRITERAKDLAEPNGRPRRRNLSSSSDGEAERP